MGPFSRIINSSVCPDWPTEQPRPPQGPQDPVLCTPAIPLRPGLPLPCDAGGSPGQYPMCCCHGNPPVSIQPMLRLLEVGGVGHRRKNRRPQLSAGACWLSWGLGNGVLSPRNLMLLGRGGAEMAGTGRPGSRVLPVNWAKWVSRGLKAREMWVQILHVHLLLRSPGDHHFIL